MFDTNETPTVYTPEQVARILQISKNTVYDLIGKGEIIAKKIGKSYRIPKASISFVFTGLDYDLVVAEKEDKASLSKVTKAIKAARRTLS